MSPPGYAPVPYIAVRAAAGGGRYIEEEVLGRRSISRRRFYESYAPNPAISGQSR
jgi:hypothetical protein